VLAAFQRYGGYLVAPRATVRALSAETGMRDGLLLTLLYLAGTHLQPLAESAAGLATMQNTSGLLMLGNGVGRAVLPPILVLVVCEVMLGRHRAYRRGLCLVPFVLVTVLTHSVWLAGVHLPGPDYLPMAIGAMLAAALTLYVRPAVPEGATE
jgi:hypothetical protein